MSGPSSRWKVTEVADLRGDRLIIVHGELDVATAPRLAALLTRLRERRHPVVLDLSEVAFMDSSGLRALLRMHNRHGSSVRLGPVSTVVDRLLALTGTAEVFGSDGDSEA